MDEPEPKTPQRDPRGRDPRGHAGAHAAPVAVDDPVIASSVDQAEAPPDPGRGSSHAVYCDNEQEVMTGFVIALRAMGRG
jgi:hypothetical protein